MPVVSHAHCNCNVNWKSVFLFSLFKISITFNNMQKQGVLEVSLDQNDNIYQFIVETLVAAHGMVTSPTS